MLSYKLNNSKFKKLKDNFIILHYNCRMLQKVLPTISPKSEPKLQKIIECHSSLIFMKSMQKPPLAVPAFKKMTRKTFLFPKSTLLLCV